jgi:hypothetical protein
VTKKTSEFRIGVLGDHGEMVRVSGMSIDEWPARDKPRRMPMYLPAEFMSAATARAKKEGVAVEEWVLRQCLPSLPQVARQKVLARLADDHM